MLTVIICTHNRAELLQRALQSLDDAKRPETAVGILVVANACTDSTLELLAQRASRAAPALPLAWIDEPRKGKSNALNAALVSAAGDLLAFIDDDQRVDGDFLVEVCLAAERSPEAAAFCGRLLPDWTGQEPAWIHDRSQYRIAPLPVPHFEPTADPAWIDMSANALPSGGNLVVRRSWVDRVGLFSTALGPVGHDLAGGEDSEWIQRGLALGARLRYEPSIVQRHHVDPARLRLPFMLRLAFLRTSAAVQIGIDRPSTGIPLWTLRKSVAFGLLALTSFAANRRRHFLLRAAAAAGEFAGYLRRGSA